MTAVIAIFLELLCTEAISPVNVCFRPPEYKIATDSLRVARASSSGWRTAAIAWSRQPSASGETLDGRFCECAFSVSIPAFTRAPVRGISVAPRHSVFCFATRPAGFGSSPKQIRSNGTERRANFFLLPPKKQTFGTWEPGPLPRLRHVCPESIREFKTEKQTCI